MYLIKDLGAIYQTEKSTEKVRCGIYECPQCQKQKILRHSKVKASTTGVCHSCAVTKHGEARTRLYYCWSDMKKRCENTANTAYINYGGRGITFCKEWKDFLIFKLWAESAGYKEPLTLDRIDVNKDYTPSNCKWSSRVEQGQNTRLIRSNNSSGYRGVTWNNTSKNWRSTISVNKSRITLGSYRTKKEAAEAYNKYIMQNNLLHPLNIL